MRHAFATLVTAILIAILYAALVAGVATFVWHTFH